jgi:hypothetical protein
VIYYRWSIPYQLTSGPLWFVAALVLADRNNLPNSVVGRPLIGLCAGILAVAPRSRGLGIESAMEAVVALQVVVTVIETIVRMITRPRRAALPAPAAPPKPPRAPRPPRSPKPPRLPAPQPPSAASDQAPATRLRAS